MININNSFLDISDLLPLSIILYVINEVVLWLALLHNISAIDLISSLLTNGFEFNNLDSRVITSCIFEIISLNVFNLHLTTNRAISSYSLDLIIVKG